MLQWTSTQKHHRCPNVPIHSNPGPQSTCLEFATTGFQVCGINPELDALTSKIFCIWVSTFHLSCRAYAKVQKDFMGYHMFSWNVALNLILIQVMADNQCYIERCSFSNPNSLQKVFDKTTMAPFNHLCTFVADQSFFILICFMDYESEADIHTSLCSWNHYSLCIWLIRCSFLSIFLYLLITEVWSQKLSAPLSIERQKWNHKCLQ